MKFLKNKILNSISIDRKIVVLLLVFECFIKNIPQINFSNIPIYIVCFISMLVLIKRFIFNRNIFFQRQNIFGYLFILSMIITAILNNAVFNYNNLVLLVIHIIMFFIVTNFDDRENKDDVIHEFVIIARFVTALHFIYCIASILYSLYIRDYEIKGLLGYSYFFSYNCVTVVGLSLFMLMYEKKNVIKFFYLFNLMIHLITIFFTQARASYLGIFIALIFIIYILMHNKIKWIDFELLKKYIFAFLFITIIITIVLSLITEFSLFKVLSKVFTTKNILSWRDIIWDASLLAFLSGNIVFGASIGGLPKFLSEFIDNVYIKNVSYNVYDKSAYNSALGIAKSGYLHNIFIQQLCSYGIFGMLIMIAFIVDSIKEYIYIIKFKITNDKFLYLMICFSFTFIAQLVISFFDDNIFYNIVYICNVFFFYSIGLISYLSK